MNYNELSGFNNHFIVWIMFLSELWNNFHLKIISWQILEKQTTFVGKNIINVMFKQQYELIN